MPLLGALLVTLFGGIFASLAKDAGRKAAVMAMAIAGVVAMVALLMAFFNQTVSPLAQQMFQTQYGQYMGLAFPPVAGTCLAAITATWIACGTYKIRMKIIAISAAA